MVALLKRYQYSGLHSDLCCSDDKEPSGNKNMVPQDIANSLSQHRVKG